MSRGVEVLREMLRVTRRRLGGLLLEGSRQVCEAESAALTSAIAALEARAACSWCGVEIPAARCEALEARLAPSPSSMEDALRRVLARASAEKIDTTSPATADVMAGIIRIVDRALHPHKGWCRDPEHEGACVPPEPADGPSGGDTW